MWQYQIKLWCSIQNAAQRNPLVWIEISIYLLNHFCFLLSIHHFNSKFKEKSWISLVDKQILLTQNCIVEVSIICWKSEKSRLQIQQSLTGLFPFAHPHNHSQCCTCNNPKFFNDSKSTQRSVMYQLIWPYPILLWKFHWSP